MNATEDGAEPMGEAPEIGQVRCHSRSYAGHRCTELAGHDGPHGVFPARDTARITDALDAIDRGAVIGVLSAADKVTATAQLAERQTQALNGIRELCDNLVAQGQGHGAAPTQRDVIRACVAEDVLDLITRAGA